MSLLFRPDSSDSKNDSILPSSKHLGVLDIWYKLNKLEAASSVKKWDRSTNPNSTYRGTPRKHQFYLAENNASLF